MERKLCISNRNITVLSRNLPWPSNIIANENDLKDIYKFSSSLMIRDVMALVKTFQIRDSVIKKRNGENVSPSLSVN